MLKINQIEGKIFKVEAQIREAKKQENMKVLESLRLESAQLRQELEDRRRLEQEIYVMINECQVVYNSKDDNKINAWLENNYKPFRSFWISKFGEDVFGETWNKINRATK
jgi:hypothetical protein